MEYPFTGNALLNSRDERMRVDVVACLQRPLFSA
jgi:hypothetical protein